MFDPLKFTLGVLFTQACSSFCVLSKEHSKDWKTKSGASSVSRSGTLEGTLWSKIMIVKIKVTNEILQSMFLSLDQFQGAIPRIRLRISSWLVSNTNSLVATKIMILSWEQFQVKEQNHDPCSRICPRLWRGTSEWWLIYVRMSLKYVAHLTTYLDLKSLKIQRSWFNFKSNLTSAIGDLANSWHLVSYVSRHNAVPYDTCPHKWTCQTWKSCKKKLDKEKN